MTVRVNKDSFNLREKLSELERPIGLKGSELMKSETAQEARDLISAGRRNLIYNGAMNVSQRGTITSGITQTDIIVDRFKLNISMGTWTIEQHASGPAGFKNSFKMTCTSPTASPSANQAAFITQTLEAQDLQGLKYGSSSARDMTISFWVQSNKTGNATFTMLQNDNSNKIFNSKYTINNANTWEYKTITIPGDNGGLFNDDNGEGLQIEWWLDGGSTFIGGDETTWRAFDNTYRNPNNLQLGRTDDDYFSITGVQLEVGKNATDFEYRSFGEDLALCQRYYQNTNGNLTYVGVNYGETAYTGWQYSATGGSIRIRLPVQMRANPTVSIVGTVTNGPGANGTIGAYGNAGWMNPSSVTVTETSPLSVRVNAGGLTGSGKDAWGLYFYGTYLTANVKIDAEF